MKANSCIHALALHLLLKTSDSFSLQPPCGVKFFSTTHLAPTDPVALRYRTSHRIYSTSTDDSDEEEEEVEPGKMRVSEIKAELDMRGVAYTDCFDKESLEQRLLEARVTGTANPQLIDKFNRQRVSSAH